MKRSKRRHLTAPECEALAQSPEGSSPLRQPLSLGRGRGGANRGLHPTPGTRRHPRAPARQSKILEFFGIQKPPPVRSAGMQSCGIREEPMDPFFPLQPQESLRSSSSSNSSVFLHSQGFVPPPRGHPRKRAFPSAASGTPNPQQHLWKEPEENIPGLSPAASGIPNPQQHLWGEPEGKVPGLSPAASRIPNPQQHLWKEPEEELPEQSSAASGIPGLSSAASGIPGLRSAASRIPNPQQHLWGEAEGKIPGLSPAASGIPNPQQDLWGKPEGKIPGLSPAALRIPNPQQHLWKEPEENIPELTSAASGIPKSEQDLWGEPEGKTPGLRPAASGIPKSERDLWWEPEGKVPELSSAASGIPNPQQHLWWEPEEDIPGLSSAASGIPKAEQDLWGEPEENIPELSSAASGIPGLSSAASGIPKPEQHLWEELENIPELSRIQQDREELEVEPLPDSHYGLLGTRNWEVPQGSMDDLPAEILRNIFAFLPVLDLYQNLSLVCRCWREIIQDPLFIPWKKLYHRYLQRDAWALHKVEQILQEFSITKEQQGCVLGLVRLVSSMPTAPKVDPSVVLQLLGSHPLFLKAQVCVLSKFPDLKSKPGPEQMWAILAVMLLFSDGVPDVRRLLRCLRAPRCPLGLQELTEGLHCMATLLLAMRDRAIPIPNRIHYNIFYCLHLMENASGMVQPLAEGRVDLCSSGWADVQLTHEQQRILNHRIEPGQTVKIMALAGTGKTSTLVKYAEKFQELKFLYLAFNKAVAEKGKKVFPRNVTCKTFHSLAFGSIGRHYKEKGKLSFRMSAFSISFLLQNREGQALFVRGKTVSKTLENFFASSDEEISEEHTPLEFKNTRGYMQPMSLQEKRINVEEAKEIWHNMKKLDGDAEKRYKMTSDGYLKLWQLSKPQLLGYDAIFVDEAQDCTPAIVDIVQSQKCGKILVGDPHQQIYTFRGAVNTLYAVPHTHLYYLTQSFRFGPEIAFVGSTILEVCKGIRNKTLLGGSQRGSVRRGRAGPVALLSRSNCSVFEDAVHLSGRHPPAKIHLIGGLERFGLSKIYDIWKLSQPEEVRTNSRLQIEDPFIRRWTEHGGFQALKEFVTRTDDRDLEVKVAIVERHRASIPELLGRIQGCHVAQEGLADYVIGTVHQAKGLEFEQVWVADDFVQIPPGPGDVLKRINLALGRTSEDEWNLLYVAVTRAKRCLLLSKSLENLLALAGERFLRVELLPEAGKDREGAPIPCCVSGCSKSLELSSGLLVKKLPLTHSNGHRDPGGFLCQACSWQCFGSLTALTSFSEIQAQP